MTSAYQAIFISPAGQEECVEVPEGWSLMEAARKEGIEGVTAECGGGAICGTCHVVVDATYFPLLDKPDMTEVALLQIVPERAPTSRLSCQIIMREALTGIKVTIPAQQLEG